MTGIQIIRSWEACVTVQNSNWVVSPFQNIGSLQSSIFLWIYARVLISRMIYLPETFCTEMFFLSDVVLCQWIGILSAASKAAGGKRPKVQCDITCRALNWAPLAMLGTNTDCVLLLSQTNVHNHHWELMSIVPAYSSTSIIGVAANGMILRVTAMSRLSLMVIHLQ